MTKDALTEIKMEKQTHPELSVLSPFDLVAEYAEKPDSEFRGDSHYALQICIVVHGGADIMLEGYRSEYAAGDLWWNMCWEPHAYRLSGRRTFVVAVNLDVEQLGSCSPFSGCNWLIPFVAKPGSRFRPRNEQERKFIQEVGQQLFHLSRKRENNWRISCWLLIHQLMIYAINRMDWTGLETRTEKESLNSFSRIRQALNKVWISDARPPSLSEAAKLCNLSSSRFSELFRQAMGVSYGKFAIRVRMSNAAKDLLSGRFSLEEIALKWGFFDSAHFCHAFKKFYRISPSQFVSRKKSD